MSLLICKNKKCKGKDFKQVKPNIYECLTCGTQRKSPHMKITKKKRKHIPKESISISIDYQPVNINCFTCGKKIDRMGTPRDQKRFNNKWESHDDGNELKYQPVSIFCESCSEKLTVLESPSQTKKFYRIWKSHDCAKVKKDEFLYS